MDVVKRKKGGPIRSERRDEIINNLVQLIINGQAAGVPIQTIAKRFNDVSYNTIRGYLDQAYKRVPIDQVEEVYKNFQGLFNKLFTICYTMLKDTTDVKDRLSVVREIRALIKDKTTLLEAFFIKRASVVEEKNQITHIHIEMNDKEAVDMQKQIDNTIIEMPK